MKLLKHWDHNNWLSSKKYIDIFSAFVSKQFQFHNDTRVLDIGCGGGILSEAMARHGAEVTAIDLAEASLKVARLHLLESNLKIDYQNISAENLADSTLSNFDVICCMEMLEHVPTPSSIVAACQQLLKPNGLVFFSTINRNLKAYTFAILGGEYLLSLIPKGTHDYQKFIKPSELASWSRAINLQLVDQTGLGYNPINKKYFLEKSVDVNYIALYKKPDHQS